MFTDREIKQSLFNLFQPKFQQAIEAITSRQKDEIDDPEPSEDYLLKLKNFLYFLENPPTQFYSSAEKFPEYRELQKLIRDKRLSLRITQRQFQKEKIPHIPLTIVNRVEDINANSFVKKAVMLKVINSLFEINSPEYSRALELLEKSRLR